MSVYLSLTGDVNILKLNDLFNIVTQSNILNDLCKYKLLTKGICIDTKRIFYHHVIHDICESYLASKGRSIVFFNYTQLDNCLFDYLTEEEVLALLSSVIAKIEAFLPIRVYRSRYSIGSLVHKLSTNDGRALNILENLKEISLKSPVTPSFQKIKNFTKKYGLTYLNKEYFDNLNTKHIFIK